MPKIEALVDVPFGTGVQPKGSQFEATKQEAEILVALNRARIVKEKEVETKDEEPQTAANDEEGAKPTKGKYQRRDMKAKT